ncbi:MAG TPA: hypothetical protein VFJ30_19165, partial [Phycisphaerae bacterium]|nr:hypothetical protein [Phycisphaerae bacterium]
EYIANLARTNLRLGHRDPETAELLRQLILKDTRPEWTDWARAELSRMPRDSLPRPAPEDATPTSQPAGRLEATVPQPGSKGPDPDGASPE